MRQCKKCGKPVRWIVANNDETMIVDRQEIRIVTALGRVVEGYSEHVCDREDHTGHGEGVPERSHRAQQFWGGDRDGLIEQIRQNLTHKPSEFSEAYQDRSTRRHKVFVIQNKKATE